ncbi:acetylcholine receptor subunit beta-like 1 [Cherax quadricarinatus]|uniref:acetylcholine receptor subunit beta-like 1 n=1 Tax=Cherax quadricarinatus TaxID=27406 RepID=UPI00387EC888
MPGILINFCALMVFSLPSESGEKIGLGTNSMLAMMVFLMAMTEKLPPTEKIPLAGVYYGTCISLIAFNIALSVIVLNLNVVGLRGYHVPVFLRVATLFVARAILVKIPAVVKKAWDVDEQSKKITPVQKLKTAMNKDGDNMVRVFVVQPQHAKSPKLEDKKESKQFPEDELDPHVLTDPFQRRAIAALESINKILSQEAADRDHATKKNDLVEEWKFISRVMDRTLFISFTLLTFFFNISILTSSPFRERFDYCPLGDKGECDKLTWEEIIEITSHAATDTHFSEGDMSHNWGGEHGSSHVLHNDYIVNTFQIPEVAYDGFDDMPPHDAAAPVSATHGMIGSSVIKRIDSPDQYDEGDSLEEENDLSLTPKSNPSTSPKNHLSPTSRSDPSTTSRSDPSTASRNDSSTTSRSDSSTNSGNGSSTTSSSDPSTIKNKRSSNSSSHPNTTVNHHSSISRNESPTTTKNRPGEV